LEAIDMSAARGLWCPGAPDLDWDCPFALPPWLEAWWQAFGSGREPMLRIVRLQGRVVGFAPLMRRGADACFLGSTDVCDYQDFITGGSAAQGFFGTLFAGLADDGVIVLDLGALRADSRPLAALRAVAEEEGLEVATAAEDVALEMALPQSWGEYLEGLGSRHRHELRRKLRRLEHAGAVTFGPVHGETEGGEGMDAFLDLFRRSRGDKRAFMTDRMEVYFRSLARSLNKAGLLELSFLWLGGRPVAAVFCVAHQGTTYLYNSGYAPEYRDLSVGFLAKALSIRDSIRRGRRRYSFLKGAEPYKHRLGGEEVPLLRVRVRLRA
jgi:CelD/BcsL family acetyltransferase involved in cellulose biosynthesis